MEQVQRRDFLKNMGGIAATAAVIGSTMAPVANAAGFSSGNDSRNDHHKGCWDNEPLVSTPIELSRPSM
jgi:hypothetical protein